MSSDSSDTDSSSGSQSGSSETSTEAVQADMQTKRVVPPLVTRKLQLRNQLDMYRGAGDEEEEELKTLTGATAEDVAVPRLIREGRNQSK